MRSPHSTPRLLLSAGWLAVFQAVGLALSLVSLPWMARGLGVTVFGQVMLAQMVAFFAVVFVDAGINPESQHRYALARNRVERAQILWNNLAVRVRISFPAILAVLLVGLSLPGLPLWMVLISLLHVLGTLCFPQWWFIARGHGFVSGLASMCTRLVSTLVVVWWVKSPADAWIALLAQSSATLLAATVLMMSLVYELDPVWHRLNRLQPERYFQQVRPLIAPAFFSSCSQSLPGLLLGYLAGTAQVGIYSAADRLTRAVAHVVDGMTQSLMGLASRWHLWSRDESHAQTQSFFRMSVVLALAACLCGMYLSPYIIGAMYGSGYETSAFVLRLLCIWLVLHWLRGVWMMLNWTSKGQFDLRATTQWVEGLAVFLPCLLGAMLAGARGVAFAMVIAEMLLWACVYMLKHAQPLRHKVSRS